MSNVLIDLGANTGQTVRDWKEFTGDKFDSWEIHSFEPIEMKWKADYPNVTLHRKIAGVKDGKEKLYVSTTNKKLGTSIFEGKEDNALVATEFDSIDLSKFIIDNFFDVNLVLKVNIEGAEYKLLPHLIDTAGMMYVKQLYVAWHNHKINIPKEEHDRVYNKVLKEASMLDRYAILPDPCRGNMFKSAKIIV